MRGSTWVGEWNDCLQSSLIVARRKKLPARKIAAQDDHGERCRRFRPFLQSSPITTHQGCVAFCREEDPCFKFFGTSSRDEKSWRACFENHFHEKSRLQSWWGKFEALYPRTRLWPHERTIVWLIFYQFTAWPKILEQRNLRCFPKKTKTILSLAMLPLPTWNLHGVVVKIDHNNSENTSQTKESKWGHAMYQYYALRHIYIAKTDPQFVVRCTVHVHVNGASNKHKIDTQSHHLLATK